jgi:antitoxin component of MazEF toxin-antitoxin module
MHTLNEALAAFTPQPDTGETTVETTIRKVGNGAFLPLTREVLRPLGLEVGQAVRVTVRDGVLTMAPADGAYARTRAAAAAARGRYPRALDILGQ